MIGAEKSASSPWEAASTAMMMNVIRTWSSLKKSFFFVTVGIIRIVFLTYYRAFIIVVTAAAEVLEQSASVGVRHSFSN